MRNVRKDLKVEGISWKFAMVFPSMSYFLAVGNRGKFIFLPPRKAFIRSLSIFSALLMPCISNFFPVCFTPSTSHPPEVLLKALTVSQTFFGNASAASFTSKSSHSMSFSLAISSSLVISLANYSFAKLQFFPNIQAKHKKAIPRTPCWKL